MDFTCTECPRSDICARLGFCPAAPKPACECPQPQICRAYGGCQVDNGVELCVVAEGEDRP